ncbi:beta-casein-like [Saccopteryx bilineata]|uniref:beta-casein-like n=1 Tax=Saccopteryx bilineata TaxID=59482 RepID=UPI00338DBAF3
MKVLILVSLVALALAREKEEVSISTETVENFSSSEESITNINKQRPEKFEKQQRREDERQDNIHPFMQPQPLFYPYPQPIPNTVLPQNVLPLAQPSVVLPILQPQVMEARNAKETIVPKRNVMPVLNSPVVPFLERQIPSVTDLKNPQIPLPLVQPVMQQVHQPLAQIPGFPTQSLLSLPQPKAQLLSQQVMTYPQRNMPVQAFVLYQEPLLDQQQFHPMTQPIAPFYNLQQVSPN